MAEKSDPALQRRLQNRKNLRRYTHTRSFNHLAGKPTAPGSEKKYGYLAARITVIGLTVLFFLVGFCYIIF